MQTYKVRKTLFFKDLTKIFNMTLYSLLLCTSRVKQRNCTWHLLGSTESSSTFKTVKQGWLCNCKSKFTGRKEVIQGASWWGRNEFFCCFCSDSMFFYVLLMYFLGILYGIDERADVTSWRQTEGDCHVIQPQLLLSETQDKLIIPVCGLKRKP